MCPSSCFIHAGTERVTSLFFPCGYAIINRNHQDPEGVSVDQRGEKWAKDKHCSEFASDCELTNDDSRKFHIATGFTEANRIICFRKTI